GTAANWSSPLVSPVLVSAVPYCQPVGSLMADCTSRFGGGMFSGYSTTSFQLSKARLALVEAPAEKPEGGAVARKSSFTSSVDAPCGTVTWKANIFTSSRTHASCCPLAVITSPARSLIGPSGSCSPGIHLG